jgi:hypothetical protein
VTGGKSTNVRDSVYGREKGTTRPLRFRSVFACADGLHSACMIPQARRFSGANACADHGMRTARAAGVRDTFLRFGVLGSGKTGPFGLRWKLWALKTLLVIALGGPSDVS